MADTYEKDLAQKSSLTTSDFIRVVGSDNVSYKQRIDNVMQTMGCTRNIGNVSDLSSVPVGVGLGYFLSATGVTEGWYLYNCASPASGSVELSLMGTTTKTMYICQLRSGNWTITKMPTRAEITPTSANLVAGDNMTFASGFENKVTKVGNVVTVVFNIAPSVAISSGATLATIPSGYRPTGQIRSVCYFSDGYARFYIGEDGKICSLSGASAGKYFMGTMTYIM